MTLCSVCSGCHYSALRCGAADAECAGRLSGTPLCRLTVISYLKLFHISSDKLTEKWMRKKPQSFGILDAELKWALDQSAYSLCAFKWYLKQKKGQVMLVDNAPKWINRLIHSRLGFPADFAAQRRIQCPWEHWSFLWKCKTLLPSLMPFFLRNSDKEGKFPFTFAPCKQSLLSFCTKCLLQSRYKGVSFHAGVSFHSYVKWSIMETLFIYFVYFCWGTNTQSLQINVLFFAFLHH